MSHIGMNPHNNNGIDNIENNWSFAKPYIRLRRVITCSINSCLSIPVARCILCSKYYCYDHIQVCLQIHSNEIEIVNQEKYNIHS